MARRLLTAVVVALALAVAASGAFYSESVQVDQWGTQVTFGPVRDITFTNLGSFDAYVKVSTYCDGDIVWITPYVGEGRFRVRAGAIVGVTFSPQTECGTYGYKGYSATTKAEEGATTLEVMAK